METTNKITYPLYHQDIVDKLLKGHFITSQEPDFFDTVIDNKELYRAFFQESFGYTCAIDTEKSYLYLASDEGKGQTTRNWLLWLFVLADAYQRKGKDLMQAIMDRASFSIRAIDEDMRKSSYNSLLRELEMDDTYKVMRGWAKCNLLTNLGDDTFCFTNAIHLFIDAAVALAKEAPQPSSGEDHLPAVGT